MSQIGFSRLKMGWVFFLAMSSAFLVLLRIASLLSSVYSLREHTVELLMKCSALVGNRVLSLYLA